MSSYCYLLNLSYTEGHIYRSTDTLFQFFVFVFLIYLFIYFWLCWIFVAVHGLSLVAASSATLRCSGRLLIVVASPVVEHRL